MTLPQWWLHRHPAVAPALAHNRVPLLTHHDLHATLEHLIDIEQAYASRTAAKQPADTEPNVDSGEMNAASQRHLRRALPTRWLNQGDSFALFGNIARLWHRHTWPVDALPPLQQQQSSAARSLFTNIAHTRDCRALGIDTSLCVCANGNWRSLWNAAINTPISIGDNEVSDKLFAR